MAIIMRTRVRKTAHGKILNAKNKMLIFLGLKFKKKINKYTSLSLGGGVRAEFLGERSATFACLFNQGM